MAEDTVTLTREQWEQVLQAVDVLESLTYSLRLSVSAQTHVDGMRAAFPPAVATLKGVLDEIGDA